MKREMSLVREILTYVESQPAGRLLQHVETSCTDQATVAEHVAIMIDAGLLEGDIHGDEQQGWQFIIYKLTWAGHDFLGTIKNDKVWTKVLAKIKEVGTDLTIDIVKELAQSFLKQEIGLT